ncbi:hypothetical protein FANTH_6289 [Fusarium anthophilum]|uniref:Uncharacterized protein n=1 Tax=Fusarium anthophilum TaxID=48485 RepID=A0A8H4ZKV4_9HYPO|nr:hypothetical protein FANTH_6289 [Fusarium anthophilum]
MAPSCLSRLLLVLLVGATHVVAHPLNVDSPSPVVVARSPCKTGRHYQNKSNHGNVTWKKVIEEMYENENKSKHGDHDDKEPTNEAYNEKWKDAWKDALEKYKNKKKNKVKHGYQDDEEPLDKTYKDKHGNHDDKEPTDGAYKDKYKDAWKDTWEKFKKEQKNKYKHHGDKYASKYRPEENGVKESTKTEYPEEVSSKDDKTETTHKGEKYKSSKSKNNKDDQEDLDDSAQKSNKYAIDHDSESKVESKVVKSSVKSPKNGKRSEKEKARQVLKNNRDGKSKHGQGSKYPGVKGKKKKTNKSGGRTLSLLDILTGGKGRLLFKLFEKKKKKPKFRLKGPLVPWPGFSAKHHTNGLAPTEEKGVQQKAKISPRCGGLLPFWAWLLIGDKIGRNRKEKQMKKKIKELEEAQKKAKQRNGPKPGRLVPTWVSNPPSEKVKLGEKLQKAQKEKEKKPSSKLIPTFDGKISKLPVKKPIKEKEKVKEKVSALSDKKSDSSETQQKKTKENKQM